MGAVAVQALSQSLFARAADHQARGCGADVGARESTSVSGAGWGTLRYGDHVVCMWIAFLPGATRDRPERY